MGVVSGVIRINSNATAILRGIRQEQTAFRRDVEETRQTMIRTWDERWQARIDAAPATAAIARLRTRLRPFTRRIVQAVAVRDLITSRIRTISNRMRAMGRMVVSPLVRIRDQVSAGIKGINSKLKSLKKSLKIPVAVVATVATVFLGGAVNEGMKLEQQQVSMKHFIGTTNKDMSEDEVAKVANQFSNDLRANANATPFETGEVMAAGSRAVAIASGNTAEAMALVTLAEDMAAASGGTQTLSDAMEALAGAKVGETERLKAFGFKISAEELSSKGFEGVSADLNDFFGGAAVKLSSTGAGLLSTITGKLKSSYADFGLNVVNQMKPAFEGVIGLIDKMTPHLDKFGVDIAIGIGAGIEAVTSYIPTLMAGIKSLKPMFSTLQQAVVPVISSIMTTIQTVMPAVLPVLQTVMSTVVNIISAAAPVVSGMVTAIGTVISTLAPVFNTIFGAIGEKVGSVIEFVASKMGFIQDVISTVAPVVSDILTTAWGVIEPVMDITITTFKLLFSVVEKVFNGIKGIIDPVWQAIKPVIESIGSALEGLSSGWTWLVDKFTGGDETKATVSSGATDSVAVGANARGTNNWKGGLTWVGEEGAELVDLPKGSRVLPHKESISYASNTGKAVVEKVHTNSVVKEVREHSDTRIEKNSFKEYQTKKVSTGTDGQLIKSISNSITQSLHKITAVALAIEGCMKKPVKKGYAEQKTSEMGYKPVYSAYPLPQAIPVAQKSKLVKEIKEVISVTVAKLADTIIVREEADIEKIGTAMADKIVQVVLNMP